MVVKDRGNALLDAIQVQGVGGGLRPRQGQLAVQGPPGAFQDFQEVGGVVAHNGQATAQGRVDVRMCVDESGHDDAALGIDKLGVRILFLQVAGGADFFDLGAVNHYAAVGQVGGVGTAGDQSTVCKNVHVGFLLGKN